MANQWFRFKEFIINQDSTAMKVGTDGVLLGAWFRPTVTGRILDIGTGTGLIALMAAQRSGSASVTGIETDPSACRQAAANFRQSAWSERLQLIEGSVFEYFPEERFDSVLSNPPFFKDSLKNPDLKKAEARHCSATFSHTALLEHVYSNILTKDGAFSLILPQKEAETVISHAGKTGFELTRHTLVSSEEGGRVIRSLMEFRKCHSSSTEKDTMFLYDAQHRRSRAYSDLTRDFYL